MHLTEPWKHLFCSDVDCVAIETVFSYAHECFLEFGGEKICKAQFREISLRDNCSICVHGAKFFVVSSDGLWMTQSHYLPSATIQCFRCTWKFCHLHASGHSDSLGKCQDCQSGKSLLADKFTERKLVVSMGLNPSARSSVVLPYCPVLGKVFVPNWERFRVEFEPHIPDTFSYQCDLCGPITEGSTMNHHHSCILYSGRPQYEIWHGLIAFDEIPGVK